MIRRPARRRKIRYTQADLVHDVGEQMRSNTARDMIDIVFAHLSYAVMQCEIVEIPNIGQISWVQDRWGNPKFSFVAHAKLEQDLKTILAHRRYE